MTNACHFTRSLVHSTLWSPDLFIRVPFQLHAEHTILQPFWGISIDWTYRTHCHLCPNRYSFSPGLSEPFEGEVPCPKTQHRNNVPELRGRKHDISLKILHQAGFETTRQAATSAKHHALTIAPHVRFI